MKRNLLLTAAAVSALLSGVQTSYSAIAVGLTSTGLIRFDTSAPGVVLGSSSFSGLSAGDSIIDIDYRPADGQLYGIAGSGRLHVIDSATGSATVNTSVGVGPLGIATTIDFNPVANRLRVFSAGDNNFRITPGSNDPATVTADGKLVYQAGDDLENQSPNLHAAAYTNNFAGAGVTTLYSIDTDFDTLVVHTVGPQFSTLSTVDLLTDNGSFVDFLDNSTGFDISTVNGANTAFLTNGNSLYTVNLATAELLSLGTIGSVAGGPGIIGLAVVPEPGSLLLAGLPIGLLALRR